MQHIKQEWCFEMAKSSQQGFLLVSVLTLSVILSIIGIALLSAASGQYRLVSDALYSKNALLAAEAGIEQSVYSLNSNDNFTGYSSAQEFFDNSNQGRGTYTTTVTNNSGDNSKTITSTGKAYRDSGNKAIATTKIKVTVVGTTSSSYSVYGGPGGLIMGGSASINNSDVYVNGGIDLTQNGGTSRIGSDQSPSNVNVANIQCPTTGGSTYPSLCTSGQPIKISDWSSVAIIGTVCATGQTQSKFPNSQYNNNKAQIRAGTSGGEGLKVGCTAPAVSPPTYDRNAQIAAVSTTKSATDSDVNCSTWRSPDGFKRTWPANLKITGNVSASSSCDLTISGNVYISGNLDMSGAAKIRAADSLGTTAPVVIVDGTINLSGAASLIANSSGTGIKFISFKSSATCNPNCTTLTGTDLKNSQGVTTVSIGGGSSAPGMVFQSYWGKIVVTGSGNVGAVAGQTIDLSGAGTVIFGTGLSSGSKTWTITSYQQVFE